MPTIPDIKEATQKHYVLVEYRRNNADYDGWNIYTWDSGYDDTVKFVENQGSWIAPVRVSSSKESISFCMRHSTDDNEWESKDGGDHMVKIAAGQRMTKVVFGEAVTERVWINHITVKTVLFGKVLQLDGYATSGKAVA